MKMKKTLFLLLFTAGILFSGHSQNVTLVVTTTHGEEQTYQLTHEGQLFFENGDRLVIDDGLGTTASFLLADIQKLVCTEYADLNENTTSALSLIPNPTRDKFIIKNLQNNGMAHIYTLDGRLMKSFEATEGTIVDISELAEGMYLLHINGQTFKMMKL